jgi:hypothetical protein
VLTGCLVESGCGNSVEYAAPAEEVFVLADGSPYRSLIENFAVSRDGQFIAFAARGDAFGLEDDRRSIIVYPAVSEKLSPLLIA